LEIQGVADLPLHEGHVPRWLIPIMRALARAIIDVMVLELGPQKCVQRFSNPLWFQAFNNAIGMDWDSSGSTTVTTAILKSVVNPKEHGFAVVGGKGTQSRRIPEELEALSSTLDFEPSKMIKVSKLVAKVDTTLLQDGHTLYHQAVFVAKGMWGVVQQGMDVVKRFARRYHWVERENLKFSVEPHEAIAGVKGKAINALEQKCEGLRKVLVDLVNEDPKKTIAQYQTLVHSGGLDVWLKQASLGGVSKSNRLVYYRPVDVEKVELVLKKVRDAKPATLEEALLAGLGPSSALALYLISDLVYSEPPSFEDPVTLPYDPFKYAFTVGGKDGIPYPVDPSVAKQVLRALGEFIERAKLEAKQKERALTRLKALEPHSD
jgi:Uncharacterized conserved protein